MMSPTRPPVGPPPMPTVSPAARAATTIALVLGVVIGIPVAVVAVATLWTPAWTFSAALADAIDAGGRLVGWAFLACVFGAIGLALSRGWAGVLRSLAEARKARIIKMQTGQPVDVIDVTPLANRTLDRAMAAHYQVEHAKASREHPELRALHYVNQIRNDPALPVEPQAPPIAGNIPTFGQLLDKGEIGPGRPLILGYDASSGQAISGNWNSLYSCGIGALQGAGKSWLAAFLLAQSALQGGRLIVCDLHAGNDESLATRIAALAPAFMCDVASTPDVILSALKLSADKLAQRVAGRGGQWPIIVAIDEWTSLLRTKVGEVLPPFMEDITEQGRKFNVNALLSAQGWTKDTASVVRNRLTSHYVMRQRPDEARYQLGLGVGQLPLDIRLLPDATGYLLDVRGNLTRVVIPQMTAADLARVGQMIPRDAAAVGSPFGFHVASGVASTARAPEATGKPHGSLMEARIDQASTAPQSAGSVPPEAARAAALFMAGNDLPAIVKELRGIDAGKGGRSYQTAAREISDLLRQAMRGI